MMKFSSIPLIFLAIAGFWVWATESAYSRHKITARQRKSIWLWLLALALWGAMTTSLAVSGFYRSEVFLNLLPGFWVPLAPVLISLILLLIWPRLRSALFEVTAQTSPRAFMLLHAVRIAAIGGVFKAHQGLLPPSFAYPIGIPDLLFGLLSLLLALNYPRIAPDRRTIIAWNGLGMLSLMAAPVLMQMGLPGPLYVFQTQPDARSLFDFPMVLAPTLVVTWMFFINAWHSYVLWRYTATPAART